MNSGYRQEKETGTMLMVSLVMFILTLSALNSIGLVPSYIDGVYPDASAIASPEPAAEALPDSTGHLALASLPQLGTSVLSELSEEVIQNDSDARAVDPERIVIHSIGVDLPVLNPTETSVEALDLALLSGSVRYPLSAKLNENGNVFIFGHSSRIAFVKNPMFKAFNRLSELRTGDTIKVTGGGMAHIYRVSEVRRTDVDEELIDLSPTQGKRLTLSTCDSFTGKSSRFVVEADLIGTYKDE